VLSPVVIYRLLLAVLLGFASVILLWTPIPTAADWLSLIGCYAISALLLDLASRHRARDLYALMTLAGLYGLLAALFIHPATALIDMPRTLFTRAMGAHTLMGLIALAIFFGIGKSPLARFGVILVGVAWAVWAKWSPLELWGAAEPTSPILLILAFVIGVSVILLAAIPLQRVERPTDFRLSPLGWLIIGAVAAVLLLFQAAQGRIDGVTAVITLVLAGFGAAILWFQKRAKGSTLLDSTPAPTLRGMVTTAILFAVGAVIGYALPRTDPDGVEILVSLFAAYGVIWLPAVSIVLGARAFVRQAGAFRL